MSENKTTTEHTVTSYDDPDAPWNQQYSEAEMANWNGGVVEEFRANGGKVGGAYEGGTLLLLTTTGAKSGKKHLVPLGALYRGDVMYVSSFIEDRYPAWWYNIKADPRVTIELGDKTYAARGRVLEGAEYDEFAEWALANNPLLADYQSKVERPLPLVTLELGEPI
ncbi:deazaflavin-dependent oxidoreductase (nitroreductase family) [Nocardia transvalensis]|uniref:Deazaflavin-dependent oxidoreductase (Nitroreductase family) n=1 Tax=Nocardia transvalensis TaxID=37333 RepID=A0A7W9UIZ1_9NOCA|nr:nitroreductase/quinone reductase family protein [Nocardia transvalensis]MBB5914220.1 deazaflavin-dependent oxidoreductase (nitroreductase family) [Nocardia transvalensis]